MFLPSNALRDPDYSDSLTRTILLKINWNVSAVQLVSVLYLKLGKGKNLNWKNNPKIEKMAELINTATSLLNMQLFIFLLLLFQNSGCL